MSDTAVIPDRARVYSGLRFDWLITIVIIVASIALSWARLPRLARNTLWAEDGRNFIGDATTLDSIWQLFVPYDGYLHLVPRSIAALVVKTLPIELWAQAMSFSSCIVVGLIAGAVFLLSWSVVAWLPARIAISAITVLIPLAPVEVLGNTANLHWYFLWLAPWLMLHRPSSVSRGVIWGVIGLIGALTEIQMALFLPLVIWRFRDRSRWPIRFGILSGVLVQVVVTILAPRTPRLTPRPGLDSILDGYSINVPLALVGDLGRTAGDFLSRSGIPLFCVLTVPVLIVGIILWKGSNRDRVLASSLFVGSLASWSAGFYLNAGPVLFQDGGILAVGPFRYGIVSSMFLLALVPCLGAVLWKGTTGSKSMAILSIAITVVALVSQFSPPYTHRDAGPVWRQSVAETRSACSTLPLSYTQRILIAPMGTRAGWAVSLTCNDLVKETQ